MGRRNRAARHDGFAVPLAVVLLVALALLTALLIEGALGEFRAGTASLEEARAAARAETALATALAGRIDSAAVNLPAGSVAAETIDAGRDTVTTRVQMLASPLARVTVSVVVRERGFRAIAGRIAFVRLAAVSGSAGELSLTPLASSWWAATP